MDTAVAVPVNVKENIFKYIFHALCGFATVGFTVYCVYQYLLDEDVARINFKEFNSGESHIYPTVTLCFPSPLVEHKLAWYGDDINISAYTNFLTGDFWDDRMVNIDYDNVSINIDDYLLGFDMFETTTWTKYQYRHNKTSLNVLQERNTTVWPPKFYISDRGLFGKCWSVDIPYLANKKIHSFGILFQSDIFPNGIRPQSYGFGVVLHYPLQLSRADFGTYEWKSHDKDNPPQYTMRFKIENTMVLKRRNKAGIPCNDKWKEDDDMIFDRILNKVNCIPSYRKAPNPVLPNCTKKQEYKDIFNLAVNLKSSTEHPPPCQQIEKVIYIFDEFNWLVDNWLLDGTNETEKVFEVLIEFLDETYMEIEQAKAYDGQSLVGNAGGYIGLFLGYSLLHAFLLLPKVIKRFYHGMVNACSRCCFGIDQHPSDCTNVTPTLTHTNGFENSSAQQINHFGMSKTGTASSHSMMIVQHETEDLRMVEACSRNMENVTRELEINDVLCENISLRHKVDTMTQEISDINEKIKDVDTNVQAISDLCDMLVVEIFNDGSSKGSKQINKKKQEC